MDMILNLAVSQITAALQAITVGHITVALQATGLVGGAVAFGAAISQYSRAQAWKRHEFVASEIRVFRDDPLVRNAMLMLDWETRYIDLFPEQEDPSRRASLVTRPMVHAALITHDRMEGRPYTREQAAIRDSFDAFFAGLERFEHSMHSKLVTADEYRPHLAYWINAVCSSEKPMFRQRLEDYVRFYRFDSIGPLFRRYEKKFAQASSVFAPTVTPDVARIAN